MSRWTRFGRFSLFALLAIVAVCSLVEQIAVGQTSKSKSKGTKGSAAESRQIDARLDKLQDTFATESAAIIDGYEKVGQFEKAKFLLEVLHKLDPKNDSVKKRLTDMDEKILERVEFDQKFSTSGDWTAIGTVEKDKPIRIEALGEFKMSMSSTSLTADGFPSEDVTRDLMGKIPTGALMAMIVTEANTKEKKAPEPFAIKTKHDFTPKHDGELYLKINAPPGAKCSGDLKLKLNGIQRGTQ